MKTAEWTCNVCGVTNRRLVPEEATKIDDRCVTCHTVHNLTEDSRPVRWRAQEKP